MHDFLCGDYSYLEPNLRWPYVPGIRTAPSKAARYDFIALDFVRMAI